MARIEEHPGIRPSSSIGRRVDLAARHAFPTISTIGLMLITELPFGFEAQTALLPAVAFSSVWFWSLYRPVALPPPIVFVIGLLLDLLGYLPLGVGVLTLLCVCGIARRLQRSLAPQRFGIVWCVFVAIALAASALTWGLTALFQVRMIPIGPAVFLAALTASLYPVLAIPLAHAHRGVANPEAA
jgi:rod shape-determining protein MreD